MTLFRILPLQLPLLIFTSLAVLGSRSDVPAALQIEHARQLSDIRAEGAPPFRLQMAFKIIQDDGSALEGSYTEVWVSKAQWRREIQAADFRRIQIAMGGKKWLLDSPTVIPERVAAIPAISELGKFPGKWKSSKDRDLDGIKVHCLEQREDYGPLTLKSELCFDKAHGTIVTTIWPLQLGTRLRDKVCFYSDYKKFGDRMFAMSYECDEETHPRLQAKIVELTAIPSQDSALFIPPEGAKESVNCLDLTQPPRQVYSPEPDQPGSFSGPTIVVLSLFVGVDGQPHDLTVISDPQRGYDESALKAVRRWRFKPASCGGEPIETKIEVQIQFRRF